MSQHIFSGNLNACTSSLESLIKLTSQDISRVNDLILAKIGSHVDMIPKINEHIFFSGGKRIRPMITLASAGCFHYTGDAHVYLAAAIEFMHTATLLHDDVVDESNLRRGKKTARTIWGNQASVLVGDYLLGQAFKIMVEASILPALDVLSSASAIIAEGEVMQLSAAHNIMTTEDDYISVIKAKTATLFAAASEMGPILSNQFSFRKPLRQYGSSLGLSFQIVDDILDYNGDSTRLGKNTGDDFREGKITLPVILSYQSGNADEKQFWKESLVDGNANPQAFSEACALIGKYDSLSLSMKYAKHFAGEARHALTEVPSSTYKDALLDTIDFCLNRVE